MAGITLINTADYMDKYHTGAYSYFNYSVSNYKSLGEINIYLFTIVTYEKNSLHVEWQVNIIGMTHNPVRD